MSNNSSIRNETTLTHSLEGRGGCEGRGGGGGGATDKRRMVEDEESSQAKVIIFKCVSKLGQNFIFLANF